MLRNKKKMTQTFNTVLLQFVCTGENEFGKVKDSVTVDENDEPVCCDNTTTGNLGTGT